MNDEGGLMNDYTVKTPEQVDISYTVAGLGTRFLALVIDLILQYVLLILLILSLVMLSEANVLRNFSEWYIAMIIISVSLISGGYFIFFELLLKGKTPGKAALKLRVVRKDGRAADVSGILIRNIIRMIDFLPFMYAIGMIAIFINKDCRRIGDIVGGTVVIAEGKKASLGAVLALQAKYTNALDDHEYAIIRDFIACKKSMTAESRNKLAEELAKPLYDRFDIPQENREAPELFLTDLLSDSNLKTESQQFPAATGLI